MNTDIEKLIDYAIASGNISEKAKAVILNKAKLMGEDPDEVEIIISGKLEMFNSTKHSNQQDKKIEKCPSCGQNIQAFHIYCTACGYEFQKLVVDFDINNLFEKLNQIDSEILVNPTRTNGVLDILYAPFANLTRIHQQIRRKVTIIESYPVPNTKAALMEFLSMAVPQAKTKVVMYGNANYITEKPLKDAWHKKAEQLIIKSKWSMQDDPEMLLILENFAKQLELK